MVLTTRRTALAKALIVPDEQTWTLSGSDPAGHGLRPVFALGEADGLLVPEVLPASLNQALRSCLAGLRADVEVERRALPGLEGHPAAALAHAAERSQHEMHGAGNDTHRDHGAGHETYGGDHDMHGDHGDMMAIVGEPSADGLVMEPIELRYGPLGTPLPGGLAVDVTLDGDVVAESTVQALLSVEAPAEGTSSSPDLLAPVAWTLAIAAAAEGQAGASPWRGLAALEAERAVSHLAWLRALGRLLGWRLLVDRCTLALEGMPPLAHALSRRREGSGEDDATALSVLQRASQRAHGVAELVGRSRVLRLRTAGLGAVTSEHAERVGVRGPVARASGLRDDARAGDPLYERLGFEPVLHSRGDAYARTLVRAEEARDSLRLAWAALRADADGSSPALRSPAPGQAVEGPRGPLRAERRADGWRLAAPGAQEALQTAGEAMVDAEWSAALVALASFDLSPWRVGT